MILKSWPLCLLLSIVGLAFIQIQVTIFRIHTFYVTFSQFSQFCTLSERGGKDTCWITCFLWESALWGPSLEPSLGPAGRCDARPFLKREIKSNTLCYKNLIGCVDLHMSAAYGVVLSDVVSKHNKSSCYIQNIHSASKKKVEMKLNNWIVKYSIP